MTEEEVEETEEEVDETEEEVEEIETEDISEKDDDISSKEEEVDEIEEEEEEIETEDISEKDDDISSKEEEVDGIEEEIDKMSGKDFAEYTQKFVDKGEMQPQVRDYLMRVRKGDKEKGDKIASTRVGFIERDRIHKQKELDPLSLKDYLFPKERPWVWKSFAVMFVLFFGYYYIKYKSTIS